MDDVQPPFIPIAGLSNFRDIGGTPITSKCGKTIATVRRGVFFRGPDTATVQPEGVARLRELGVITDFDLRSKGQIEKAGGATDMKGIQRVWCPAFPDGEYSPEKAAMRYVQYSSEGTAGIVEAFTDILIHGSPACRTMLLHLASQSPSSPTACYIHCTTGNNRSGVFVAIILSLLGVAQAQIAEEYALSDIGLRPARDAAVARLLKSPVFSNDPENGKRRAERMVGARPESMLAMLDMVQNKWGGAEGYVSTVCGLNDEDIRKIKKLMIVPISKPGHVRRISNFISTTWKSLA